MPSSFFASHYFTVATEYDEQSADAGCSIGIASGELVATCDATAKSAYAGRDVWPDGNSGRAYFRFRARRPTGQAGPGTYVTLFRVLDTAGVTIFEIRVDGSNNLYLYSPAGGLRSTEHFSTSIGLLTDTFKTVEISALRGTASAGGYQVILDGFEVFSREDFRNATTAAFRRVRAGMVAYVGTASARTYYLDEVGADASGYPYGNPDVSITFPEPDSFLLPEPVTFRATAIDPDGISEFAFELDGEPIVGGSPDPGEPGEATYDLSTLSLGTHALAVTVTDNAGYQTTETRTFDVVAVPYDPPPEATHVIARARYQLLVGWSAVPAGVFSIGVSTIGGSHVLAASDFPDEPYTGAYDDVTHYLDRFETRYGRTDSLAGVSAATGRAELLDPTGRFNPANEDSPLYGDLGERMHPVRLVAIYDGEEFPLFNGWARVHSEELGGRQGRARLEFVDLLYRLRYYFPTIASTGATTVGAAIGTILTSVGWAAGRRRLATGSNIADFSADGTKSALALIESLLDVDLGIFYHAPDGDAVYEDRVAKYLRPQSESIIDVMTKLVPELDWDLVQNIVEVEREQNDYVATESDATSISRIGPRSYRRIVTSYLANNAQADELAEDILERVSSPMPPLRPVVVEGRDPDTLATILGLNLIDRLRVRSLSEGVDVSASVEQISHSVESRSGLHRTTLIVSQLEDFTPFLIGTSTLAADPPAAGAHVFV